MAEIKTEPTSLKVKDFIKTIKDGQKQNDSIKILKIMKDATGEKPKIWGSSIIGFGNIRLKSPAIGIEVPALVDGELNPGEYSVKFDAVGLSSGVDFYQFRTGDFIQTNKMILVK